MLWKAYAVQGASQDNSLKAGRRKENWQPRPGAVSYPRQPPMRSTNLLVMNRPNPDEVSPPVGTELKRTPF